MPVIRIDPTAPDPERVARAAAVLRAGGLVAFPTETVYGLGADALSQAAVQAVFAVKGRPADNPLIVHVADIDAITALVRRVTPLAQELAARWWPGPLTLVLDVHPDVPPATTGGLRTVAVRVPDHPVALALITAAGLPLAAPSANRSGRPSPTTAAHVAADLGDRVDLVLDGGPCRVGVESTVVDARGDTPFVLREGGVTREDLGIGPDERVETGDPPASPGTQHPHYQPRCRVVVAAAGTAIARAVAERDAGERTGLLAAEPAPSGVVEIGPHTGAADLGRRLYEALRAAEDAGVDVLVVEAVPLNGIGRAVMDRLTRAASARR
jgi:L-threonylcarbamoyladenylate synthase